MKGKGEGGITTDENKSLHDDVVSERGDSRGERMGMKKKKKKMMMKKEVEKGWTGPLWQRRLDLA